MNCFSIIITLQFESSIDQANVESPSLVIVCLLFGSFGITISDSGHAVPSLQRIVGQERPCAQILGHIVLTSKDVQLSLVIASSPIFDIFAGIIETVGLQVGDISSGHLLVVIAEVH